MPRSRGRTRNEKPRAIDIRWRVTKAEGFLRAAELCLRENELNAAVSRAYYACYHVIAASLEYLVGLSRVPWEHKTLLHDFRQSFANKSFLFNKADADTFDQLMNLRFAADYRDTILNPTTVERRLNDAKQLFNKAREVLR